MKFQVLNIENVKNLINFQILSRPYSCILQNDNSEFLTNIKYICLVQDKNKKIFLIYYDQIVFNKLKEYYRKLPQEEFYKTIFCFDPQGNVKFEPLVAETQSTDFADKTVSDFMDQFLDNKTRFFNEKKFSHYVMENIYV